MRSLNYLGFSVSSYSCTVISLINLAASRYIPKIKYANLLLFHFLIAPNLYKNQIFARVETQWGILKSNNEKTPDMLMTNLESGKIRIYLYQFFP